jgi:RHS repeat-associated protein
LNVWKYYTYDFRGRLKNIEQKIEEDNNRKVMLAEMEYNALGQVKTKKIHKNANGSFLQNVDYKYNIRGALEAINNPTTQNGENDLFGIQLYHTDIAGLSGVTTTAQYSGNIAGIKWQVFGNNTGLKYYGYTYDNKGRLTKADHKEYRRGIGRRRRTYNDRYNVEGITYDKNGNIKSLKRKGLVNNSGGETFGLVDNLTYLYDGNQLKKVSDKVKGRILQGKQFKDGANLAQEYTYDQNGNMTADKNKGISTISYNVLNLPESIRFSNGNSLRYYYAANGRKLKEVFKKRKSTIIREYAAGMLYINNVMQYMQTETGRVMSDFTYIHSIADHQGNVRACFKNNKGKAQLIQEDHYYPFGLTMGQSIISGPENKNLYSGKEWKNQNGEQWYDFGARNYDAALGRWFNPDPFAESYGAVSPYNYCLNDPVNFVDPFGLHPVYNWRGKYYYDSKTYKRISMSDFRYWMSYGRYPGKNTRDSFWDKMYESGAAVRHYSDDNWRTSYSFPGMVPLPMVKITGYRIGHKNYFNKISSENAARNTAEFIWGKVGQAGGDDGWAVTAAAGYMVALQADLVTPDPTDVAWPKWVGHAVLGTTSAIILYSAGKNIADYYTTSRGNPDDYSWDPEIQRLDNGKYYPNGGMPPKWFWPFAGGVAAYELYKNRPIPGEFVPKRDNTNVVPRTFYINQD